MKNLFVPIFAFFLIFFFSSVDSSISPMIKDISLWYGINLEKGLLFISSCTGAVVFGVLLGPWLMTILSPKKILLISGSLLCLSTILFAIGSNFYIGIFFRFISGFASGLIASLMWWLAYHGVEKKYMGFMLANLMSARPLASAIGVPLMGLMAYSFSWIFSIMILASLIFVSFILLYLLFPTGDGSLLSEKNIIKGYLNALKIPYSFYFYLGFFINRLCYFGFYAICGIWFLEHYNLNLKSISYYLFIIGIGEAIINFFSPKLIIYFGYLKSFLIPILISILILPIFIFGMPKISVAVAFITLFMLLDRFYSMALVLKIPEMFNITGNKTIFGSLNTLSAWLSISFISAFSSWLIKNKGIFYVELSLCVFFLSGSAILFYCLKKNELSKNSS